MELVQYGETPSIFSIWYCRCHVIDLPRMLEHVLLTYLVTLYDYALHKGSFLPKYVDLFEKFLKFWSFLWMFPEQVRDAVHVLDFTKLITQTLLVTNMYDKNRSFAAKFVKKRTLSHKFRQADPVSWSSDKIVLCPWVLEDIFNNKVLTTGLNSQSFEKGSYVANFWQIGFLCRIVWRSESSVSNM